MEREKRLQFWLDRMHEDVAGGDSVWQVGDCMDIRDHCGNCPLVNYVVGRGYGGDDMIINLACFGEPLVLPPMFGHVLTRFQVALWPLDRQDIKELRDAADHPDHPLRARLEDALGVGQF